MGTVITVSTRRPAREWERMARARALRDNAVQLAARTARGRAVHLLAEVAHDLAGDPALAVAGPTAHGDGFSYVWVSRAGGQQAGVWGQPVG
jgi:hypothetical protein